MTGWCLAWLDYCLFVQYFGLQHFAPGGTGVPKMDGLTEKQHEVFAYLRGYLDADAVCPSRDEIRRHFGYNSPNAVTSHLRALESKGYISWSPGKARALRISSGHGEGRHSAQREQIPILGQVAAGLPILAETNVEDSLSLPKGYLGSGTHFAVSVRGDSMRDAGIDDGDIALLHSEEVPARGKIMAVVIEDEAVLKRVFPSETELVLRSENPAYDDIVFGPANGDSIRIAGRLVGLLKRFG